MRRIVLDTNVLVAAGRSNRGASFRLLSMVGPEAGFGLTLSVPLVLEYEMALKRETKLSHGDVEAIVDYLCANADLRPIYFLWRPFLRDPSDEMVLEVAVGGEAELIVTHNVRDFAEVEERFGIRVVRPGAFLAELEGDPMSTMSLRLPESLHERARELAKQEGVSINQLVATALAEKVSALDTVSYLEERATRGSRKAFEAALARVPSVPPVAGDEVDS